VCWPCCQLSTLCPWVAQKSEGRASDAGIQQVAVFQRLVVLVVVGGQAQSTRLDAHVDVLGHQHHFARGVAAGAAPPPRPESGCLPCLAASWWAGCSSAARSGTSACRAASLWPVLSSVEACRSMSAPGCRPARPGCDWFGVRCGPLRSCLFVTVQLLQHDHRQDRCRAPRSGTGTSGSCSKHVGVQHEELWSARVVFARLLRLASGATRRPLWHGLRRQCHRRGSLGCHGGGCARQAQRRLYGLRGFPGDRCVPGRPGLFRGSTTSGWPCGPARADARAGASKSLRGQSSRHAWTGQGAVAWSGFGRSWEVEKQCRKSEKAALSQGGFLRGSGCKLQRHANHYA